MTEVSRETSAAILHQELEFVGQMKIIGEQLTRMGEGIGERDAQNAAILQGLVGALDRNTSTIAGNTATTKHATEVMSRAIDLLEAQAATIDALKPRLDAYERDPLDEDDEGKSDGHAARAG